MKKGEITLLCDLLAAVNVAQMSAAGRVAITRNFMSTKKVAKEVEEAKKQAAEKLITDEFKELQNKEDKTDEEKAKLSELEQSINRDFSEILNPILLEDYELELKMIDENDFDKLIESSNLNQNQFDFLHDKIVDIK